MANGITKFPCAAQHYRWLIHFTRHQCIPDEVGKNVHVPTLKEMANEIKRA
jgi:hypothetical protein